MNGSWKSHPCPQFAQLLLEHESHDGSDMPATAFPPLSAKKTEILRRVFPPPHLAQTMGASACDMGRMTSNSCLQSLQMYS
jgi:hypothetical protein